MKIQKLSHSVGRFAPLVTYWIFLTYKLLTPTPWEFVGGPQKLSPFVNPHSGKSYVGIHILAFMLLAVFIQVSISVRKSRHRCLYFAVIYGGLTELGQFFIPGRISSLTDVYANSLGLGLGIILVLTLKTNAEIYQENRLNRREIEYHQ